MYIVRLDERMAPAEAPDRNLTYLKRRLIDGAPIAPQQASD